MTDLGAISLAPWDEVWCRVQHLHLGAGHQSVGDGKESVRILARLADDESLRMQYKDTLRATQRERLRPDRQSVGTRAVYEPVMSR